MGYASSRRNFPLRFGTSVDSLERENALREGAQTQIRKLNMGIALSVVRQAYEAFGRQDIPRVLELIADDADWDFIGSASLPYSGRRQSRKEVADFFAAVVRAEDIHAFEPRNFIEADEHVTVLGWIKATARDTQRTYESEWVHVVTVRNGKIVHWRGFANTAARYGL